MQTLLIQSFQKLMFLIIGVSKILTYPNLRSSINLDLLKLKALLQIDSTSFEILKNMPVIFTKGTVYFYFYLLF